MLLCALVNYLVNPIAYGETTVWCYAPHCLKVLNYEIGFQDQYNVKNRCLSARISLTDVCWYNQSEKTPYYTQKSTIEKNRHCKLIQFFPWTRNAKKLRGFNFLYFHSYWNLNLSPTGTCYQAWNNLVARGMVAKSMCRLATNNIFTNIVVSLLTGELQDISFCDSGYVILYLLLVDVHLLQGTFKTLKKYLIWRKCAWSIEKVYKFQIQPVIYSNFAQIYVCVQIPR